MEIGPIAGIRVMPAIKTRPVDPELTAFAEVESSARPDDQDSYAGSDRKAGGAEEPEEEQSSPDKDSPADAQTGTAGGINFFA